MSGAEASAVTTLYSDVGDIVKQQGKRSRGLIHRLQSTTSICFNFPTEETRKIKGGLQKAD